MCEEMRRKKASDRNRINQLPLTDYSSLEARIRDVVFLHNSLLACIQRDIGDIFFIDSSTKFPSMASHTLSLLAVFDQIRTHKLRKGGDAIKTEDHQLFFTF
jgi:hypothetical protein